MNHLMSDHLAQGVEKKKKNKKKKKYIYIYILVVRGRCWGSREGCFRSTRVLEHLLWQWGGARARMSSIKDVMGALVVGIPFRIGCIGIIVLATMFVNVIWLALEALARPGASMANVGAILAWCVPTVMQSVTNFHGCSSAITGTQGLRPITPK